MAWSSYSFPFLFPPKKLLPSVGLRRPYKGEDKCSPLENRVAIRAESVLMRFWLPLKGYFKRVCCAFEVSLLIGTVISLSWPEKSPIEGRFLMYSLDLIGDFHYLHSSLWVWLFIFHWLFLFIFMWIPYLAGADTWEVSQQDKDLVIKLVRKLKSKVDVKTLGNLLAEDKVWWSSLQVIEIIEDFKVEVLGDLLLLILVACKGIFWRQPE